MTTSDAPDAQRDHVLLVDERDRPLRVADKAASHHGRGLRHRAFTLLIFDQDARLLLAQRADAKPLWAQIWDGTVASHPRVGEGYVAAARRRLPDELDIEGAADLDVAVLNRFLYRADHNPHGAENELCATLITRVPAEHVRGGKPGEISALRWVTPAEFLDEARTAPEVVCPWLLIALEFVARRRWSSPSSTLADIANTWAEALDADAIAVALSAHQVDAHYATIDD